MRSDYYDSQNALIKQDEAFVKQYSSLVRIIKKLAPIREIKGRPMFPDWISKEYMTDHMFQLYQDGYDIRG
jgi:hypothetical protein